MFFTICILEISRRQRNNVPKIGLWKVKLEDMIFLSRIKIRFINKAVGPDCILEKFVRKVNIAYILDRYICDILIL